MLKRYDNFFLLAHNQKMLFANLNLFWFFSPLACSSLSRDKGTRNFFTERDPKPCSGLREVLGDLEVFKKQALGHLRRWFGGDRDGQLDTMIFPNHEGSVILGESQLWSWRGAKASPAQVLCPAQTLPCSKLVFGGNVPNSGASSQRLCMLADFWPGCCHETFGPWSSACGTNIYQM